MKFFIPKGTSVWGYFTDPTHYDANGQMHMKANNATLSRTPITNDVVYESTDVRIQTRYENLICFQLPESQTVNGKVINFIVVNADKVQILMENRS